MLLYLFIFFSAVSVQIFRSFLTGLAFTSGLRVLFVFWLPDLYHTQVLQIQVTPEQLHSPTHTRVFSTVNATAPYGPWRAEL